jgi:hypothetical protein
MLVATTHLQECDGNGSMYFFMCRNICVRSLSAGGHHAPAGVLLRLHREMTMDYL